MLILPYFFPCCKLLSLLVITCYFRTEYYHRSFLISGCNTWNNLPDYIRKSVALNSFKFNMFKYLLAKTQF